MQGQLFSQDFLLRGIALTPPYQAVQQENAVEFAEFLQSLQRIFAARQADSFLNEAQTEQEIIDPVLTALGWGDGIFAQVNLSSKGRSDVPDRLLFASAAAKATAMALLKDDQRYRHGLAITTTTLADFVTAQVLALTYTAHDMAPFARDLGHVDGAGTVLPPFVWDEDERRARMAALDALFFWLYGLGADDAAYILGTFPIVREQDIKAFGSFRTQNDILATLALLPSSQ